MKKTYSAGTLAERRAADAHTRARPTRGSGCGNDPGDYELKDYLVEVKSTVNKSISLKYQWLGKIVRQALSRNRQPALQIMFTDDLGRPYPDGNWIAVPEHVFKELIGEE